MVKGRIEWTDQQLTDQGLFLLVTIEGDGQVIRWGVQTHHPFEWLAYTLEELGELSQAMSEWLYRGGSLEDVEKEAIQVATLALKIVEMAREKRSALAVATAAGDKKHVE